MHSDVPNCATPLIFESGPDDVQYGIFGTGFLCSWKNTTYFVTARHCLEEGDYENLRVPRSLIGRNLLGITYFINIRPLPGLDDTDYTDLAVFLLAENVPFTEREEGNLSPARVADVSTNELLTPEILFTARGFPIADPHTYLDYDTNTFHVRPFNCDAKYLGKSGSKFCHSIQFVNDRAIADINGMSGSPVFAKLPYGRNYLYILTGVLIRAGRFISIEVLKEVIRRIA